MQWEPLKNAQISRPDSPKKFLSFELILQGFLLENDNTLCTEFSSFDGIIDPDDGNTNFYEKTN